MFKYILILTLVLFLQACGEGVDQFPSKLVGKNVTIQFNRNSLGAASPIPISPNTDGMNGGETSIYGIVEKFEGNWVLLKLSANKVLYIPKESILLISSETK